jgi:enoyl-CoA hydratase/carnithine racemase
MRIKDWKTPIDPEVQLAALVADASRLGLLVVRFAGGDCGTNVSEILLDQWIASRAVTVADVGDRLGGAGLDVALNCDLVYLRSGAVLDLGPAAETPSAGVVRAVARSGRTALDRVLLDAGQISEEEAVRIGLVHRVVPVDEPLPLPDPVSVPALTAARDLMRSSAVGESGRVLELATFRLLFAAGDPCEGARAFLERRQPTFSNDDTS